MPKLSALAMSLGMAFYISGCGISTSASGGISSGILVDDIIIGATVFCDQNNNGILDGGEPSAVTDQNGQFVFASTCTAPIASVAGTGVDRTTQRAPQGTYRALAGSSVLSPFTTMQVESGLSTPDFQRVMQTMGLGAQDPATFNPVDQPAPTAMAAAAAAKILNDIAETSVAAGAEMRQNPDITEADIEDFINNLQKVADTINQKVKERKLSTNNMYVTDD